MEIENKVVVITGAASGIGEALARRFAQENPAALVLVDVNELQLQKIATEVAAEPVTCDVGDEAAIKQLVSDVETRHGGIDLFCGNAGILRMGGIETDPAEFQQVMDINVMAHVHTANAMLPGMIRRGGGYFLVTASAAGLLTQLGSLSYSVSKHAALAVAEWLAISYGHLGIKVSALCPQAVESAMTADGAGVAGVDGVLPAEKVAEYVVDGIRDEAFLILPHSEVKSYFSNKANDYERWINGMRKLQDRFPEMKAKTPE